jgi:hypothetical protein
MSVFQPQFRDDVAIVMQPRPPRYPEGYRSPVNPHLCLTDDSAKELAAILSDLGPTIVQVSPAGQMFGIFSVSSLVPGLQFPDGTVCNAGDLAMWWVRTVQPSAEALCRREIDAAMSGR